MKIALVRRKYTPFGGAERFLEQLAELLIRRGHEIHLFANQWKKNSYPKAAFVFHPVPIGKEDDPFPQILSFASNAEHLLKQGQFDVIHGFDRCPFLDLYRASDGCHQAWLFHQTKNRRLLRNLTRDLSHQTILFLERQILTGTRTRLIICNSELVKREIQKYYDVPNKKLRVLPNGVDLESFHPRLREKYRMQVRMKYGISEETLVLLFVGSGFERKGLPLVIHSLPRIHAKLGGAVKLVVMGEGKVEKYEAQAEQLGCRTEVLFVGPCLEPHPWYGMADLFVLPTLYDPFSNAAMEALASGLPVITTRLNGVSEVMEDKQCGVILGDPHHVGDFVSAVVRLSCEKERERMAPMAREAAALYPMEEYVKKTLSIYNELTRKDEKRNYHELRR